MFITLVAIAFGFVIGLSWHSHKSSQGALGAKDSTLPAASVVSPRPEIASNSGSGGKSLPSQNPIPVGTSLFPASPKPKAITGASLSANLPQDSATPSAQVLSTPPGNRLSSTNSSNVQSGQTFPASLNPNLPPENTTSSDDAVSPESPTGEQPTISFGVSPEFQAKIIKKITPLDQQKVIALTFDDGPWPSNTLKILEILKKNNIKATFFWVGQALKDHPQIGKQVVAEGHAIGNHTWHHWYRRLDASTAARELDDTAQLIYTTTGVRTSLFRPPGAVMNNGVADYAIQQKNAIVMWSNDPMDYRPLSAHQLVKNVIRKAHPGAIVLMHDGGGNHPATVQALPQIIAKLTEQGYQFVTIPQLLEMTDPKKSAVIAKKDWSPSFATQP
jgi:peptidoglycan/xylan/chitin deacetylase (PgdA/CDA1 family)